MGRGMKRPFFFKQRAATANPQAWHWPSCKNPRTLSIRLGDDVFKTVNSMFFDQTAIDNVVDTDSPPSCCFTNSSDTASVSTEPSERDLDAESIETVVREVVRSERLFFEPIETNSILKDAKSTDESKAELTVVRDAPFKESVVVAVETADPYWDFRRSMEEMVRWQAMSEDWECLEAMLGWYLRMNRKEDHPTIVGAFVDCVAGMVDDNGDSGRFASASLSDYATCYSSSMSSFRSLPWCPSERVHNEIEEGDGVGNPTV